MGIEETVRGSLRGLTSRLAAEGARAVDGAGETTATQLRAVLMQATPLGQMALGLMLSQVVLFASPLREGRGAERAERDALGSASRYMASFLRNSANLAYISLLIAVYARSKQPRSRGDSIYAQAQLRALTDSLFYYLAHGYYLSLGYHLTVGDWKTIAFCFHAAGVVLKKWNEGGIQEEQGERVKPSKLETAQSERGNSLTKSIGVLFSRLQDVGRTARVALQDELLMAILLLLALGAGYHDMSPPRFVEWLRFLRIGSAVVSHVKHPSKHLTDDESLTLTFCHLAAEVLASFASFGGAATHFLALFFLTTGGTEPGGLPGGTEPGGLPGGTAPGGLTGGTAPGGLTGGTAPGGLPGGTEPRGLTGGTAPGGLTGGTAPGGLQLETTSQPDPASTKTAFSAVLVQLRGALEKIRGRACEKLQEKADGLHHPTHTPTHPPRSRHSRP